jgi:hypothetical protein
MVISFSVEEARNQLLNEGVVYTYRWKRRAFFFHGKGDIEDTWANAGRLKPKICDVLITEVGQIEPTEKNLAQYFEKSGFWNVASWCLEIVELGLRAKKVGWLYKVTKHPTGVPANE